MIKLKACTTGPSYVVLGIDPRASCTLGKHSTSERGYRFPVSWLTLHSNSSPRVGKHQKPCLIGCFRQRAVMVRGILLRLSFLICGRHCFLHLINFSPWLLPLCLGPFPTLFLHNSSSSLISSLQWVPFGLSSLLYSFSSWDLWMLFFQAFRCLTWGKSHPVYQCMGETVQ